MFSRACVAASFLLCVSVVASSQTAPSVSDPLRQGQDEIKINGQAKTATYTDVKLGVCVTDTQVDKCDTYITATPTLPLALTDTGNAIVTLKSPLKAGQYVMVAQAVNGAQATYSKPVQVTAIDPVVITTSPMAHLLSVSGTAQVPSASGASPLVYKEVSIFVCASQEESKAGKVDCSGSQDPKDTSLALKLDGDADSVKMATSKVYTATFKSEVANSTNLWVVEKITPAHGSPFAVLSKVLSLRPPVKPTIDKSQLQDGLRTVVGKATPSVSGSDQVLVHLCVAKADKPAVDGHRVCDEIGPEIAVSEKGDFNIPYTLDEGDEITVVQRSDTSLVVLGDDEKRSDAAVVSPPENERWHSDFAVGILLSKEQQELSQANMFMALNTDYALVLPGYYKQFQPVCPPKTNGKAEAPCHVEPKPCCADANTDCCKSAGYRPGLNFFFQSRLTAVPVTSQTVNTTSTGVTTSDYDSFLASRKSAHFEFGGYLPMYFDFVKKPSSLRHQAFFVAPVVRAGFNSLVDSVSSGTPVTDSTGNVTTPVTKPVGISDPNSTVYNFGLVGVRIGTSDIKRGSPHVRHYIDFGVGRFSNIRDLYCPANDSFTYTPTGGTQTTLTGCQRPVSAGSVTPTFDPNVFHHYTGYRFVTEGYLDLDGFTLGFSINTRMNAFKGARSNDFPEQYQKAKDDLRFLFGYTVDAKKLLTAITSISKSGSDSK